MTVAVAFDGTVIDTADNVANWAGIKITSGGGFAQPSAADAAYEGSNNITLRSDNKRVYAYTDIGAGNELDFTGGGNADGDMFYIWVNFLPSPLLALRSVGGLGIFMSTNAPASNNYALWYIHGRDTYTGGWIRLCVDPNKTPSIDTDSFNPASVRYFGAFAHNDQGAAKYDNFVIDQCAHGKGLIVTGSSTLGLVEELLADEIANRHGVVTALNQSGTAAGLLGQLTLGDDVTTNAAKITDNDSKLFLQEPLYYETTLQPSCPATFMGINIVGNGSGDTNVAIGSAVGSDNGRNGMSIVGNPSYDFSFDRDDGAVESSDFYGGSFENLTGVLSLDGNHDYNGMSMSGCSGVNVADGSSLKSLTSVLSGAIDLNATALLSNSIIIENTAVAAVLCPDLGNVTDCSFTSDGTGYAVDLGTGITTQTMSWNNAFSNYAASGGTDANKVIKVAVADNNTLTINNDAGGDLSVHNASTGNGAVSVVSGQVTLTLTPLIANTEIRIYEAGTQTPAAGTSFIEDSGASFGYTYTYAPATEVDIVIHHIDYEYIKLTNILLGSGNANLPVTQSSDRWYSNP